MALKAFVGLVQSGLRSSSSSTKVYCLSSKFVPSAGYSLLSVVGLPSCRRDFLLLPFTTRSPQCTSHFSSVATSNKVEVNGINYHYERAGKGEHAVLLLPGALGSSETDFRPQIDGLSGDKYTIIAFDPRGYGKSRPPNRDWPLLYLHRDAEDAASFMQKLGFPRYSILGWSDGGITGIILASANPGNVKKLMVWGANAYVSDEDVKLYKAVGNIDDWSERMRAPFLAMYGEEYFRTQWEKWVQAISLNYQQRNGDICIGSLPNIKCNTLIINGLKDPIVPQEHPKFLQKHIPNCRTIEWPEGKHNLHLRYHKEFNETAEAFLDEPE